MTCYWQLALMLRIGAMPPTEKLSRREREIMDVLYALGDSATAEDIRARLSDPPSYSAVRAMLVKLETKGFIRHRAEGLRYVYSPITSRDDRAEEGRRAS